MTVWGRRWTTLNTVTRRTTIGRCGNRRSRGQLTLVWGSRGTLADRRGKWVVCNFVCVFVSGEFAHVPAMWALFRNNEICVCCLLRQTDKLCLLCRRQSYLSICFPSAFQLNGPLLFRCAQSIFASRIPQKWQLCSVVAPGRQEIQTAGVENTEFSPLFAAFWKRKLNNGS